jgi:hypothetical protein
VTVTGPFPAVAVSGRVTWIVAVTGVVATPASAAAQPLNKSARKSSFFM